MKFDVSLLQQFDIIELYSDLLSCYWFIQPDILVSCNSSKQLNTDDIKNVYRMSNTDLRLYYFVNRTNVVKRYTHLLDLVWSNSGTVLIQRRRVSVNSAGFVEIDGQETVVRATKIKEHIRENPTTYTFDIFGQICEADKNKLLALKQDQPICP